MEVLPINHEEPIYTSGLCANAHEMRDVTMLFRFTGDDGSRGVGPGPLVPPEPSQLLGTLVAMLLERMANRKISV